MNAPLARRTIVSRTIGAVIVAAALVAGAGVGDLTSPDRPAHGGTPDGEQTCSLMCADVMRHGGGGNVPNTLDLSRSGGVGNR